MQKIREVAGRVWRQYRRLPAWGQVAIAILLIVVAVLTNSEDKQEPVDEIATAGNASGRITTTTETPETSTSTTLTTTTTTTTASTTLRSIPCEVGQMTCAVSRDQFGEDWPLTVEGGVLSCQPGTTGSNSAVFIIAGETYSVNGTAQARAEDYEARPLEEIWADNPAIAGAKRNIGPLIDLGLTLC